MIGSLMYLTASRPDIMFAIYACARHQVTPKECHLHVVKMIFRYLKGHPKIGLWYPKESLFDLVAYTDSDYGGATQDHKSTTGGCQFLGRRLISWQCKKQTIVATSTTEAEYVTAASCCGQVLWIQNQLLDYGLSMPCEALSREISSSILRFNKIIARLQFCDYHNMVAILEKIEHNVDFHPIVDFVEASPLRYALTFKPTVYVSYIRQFWSTARIETTKEGTKNLATIDCILRIVSESSIRRNLKLNDEAGISSVPDAKLFENLTLMGYIISLNQKFNFQKRYFSHQWKYLIHTIMQCMSPKSTGYNEFSSIIATALVCLANNRVYKFSKMIFDAMGEGSGTPTNLHHTPSPEAQQTSPTTHSSPTLPPVTTAPIPTVTLYDTPYLRQYTRRARIAQSSALPPVADELASPLRDVSQGEACPTDSGFKADQDRANIAKTSTLPHESTSRVPSFASDEASLQLKIRELKDLCTSRKRQQSDLDKERGGAERSGDDAPNNGRRLDVGEEAAERVSDDTKEMATVLTSMDAATVLASGVAEVPTGSDSIPTAGPPATGVPTGSDMVPTVESETPKKKKVQEQIDAQVARELEDKMTREDQRMSEQIARDAEIARIHAEEELKIMIDGLDKNNETVAKYQDNYAKVHKYQSQQRKPLIKKQQREFYTSVLRNQAGWKAKHFKGMTLEEIKENFDLVWKQIHDFILIGSKEEAERFKRKGIRFEKESAKKLKTSKEVPEEVKSPDEVPEEKVKVMMQLVPIEEVYVEALQVKHPIIDWKVHTEGQRSYWKITSIRPPPYDKEMELWVELKRLYEPDDEVQLWTRTQNLMHAPVEWKLYDTCGVHHVTSKDKEICMLVEKDYPLRKGLAIGMISYKLQVENYSKMANHLILKIYKTACSPRQQGD
uniref:Uncharacterized mitochondrial protein AtMg00810-like n=1 Tax=Tanacetum cinerariifolium TaxID=118510 RepID=A0A699HU14_TANCI|nr:uncharacterized mitochondrial protein AtMg00810-like [Tanacetum cinerariifolium]